MRTLRVAAAATTLTLLGAAASVGAGPAGAANHGTGTSEASTTVLSVALGSAGDLLKVRLLGDDARATIDRNVAAAPEAYSRLSVLDISSRIAGLDQRVPATPYESRSPGGNPSVTSPSVSLATTPVPAAVATGSLNPSSLSSAVDANGARSAMDAELSSLSLAGGLVSVSGITSKLGASGARGSSDGSRSVKVADVNVLDLGALLNGLGINLADLLPSQIAGLLGELGVNVPGVGNGAALQALVDDVQQQLTSLAAQVDAGLGIPTTTTVTQVVDSVGLGGIIPTSTVTTITNISDDVAQANALIDELQDALAGVLSDALDILDGLTLLSVDGVEVGLVTKATETVSGSVAEVVAKIGSVSIGNVNLPAIDLAGAVAAVNTAVSTVNGTVKQVLGAVAPGLGDLVTVSVLEPTKSITSSGGYIRSRAGMSALAVTIKPPVDLTSIVGGILGQRTAGTSAGSLIGAAGVALPSLSSSMLDLNSVLGAVSSLAGGATIKVLDTSSASEFAAASTSVPADAPGGNLPRTGGNALPLAALGALLLVAGLAAGRWAVVAYRNE